MAGNIKYARMSLSPGARCFASGIAIFAPGIAILKEKVASPQGGLASPSWGIASYRQRLTSPHRGLVSSARGVSTPSRGVASYSQRLASHRRGVEGDSRRLASSGSISNKEKPKRCSRKGAKTQRKYARQVATQSFASSSRLGVRFFLSVVHRNFKLNHYSGIRSLDLNNDGVAPLPCHQQPERDATGPA
jgi:hypothetical protein